MNKDIENRTELYVIYSDFNRVRRKKVWWTLVH